MTDPLGDGFWDRGGLRVLAEGMGIRVTFETTRRRGEEAAPLMIFFVGE